MMFSQQFPPRTSLGGFGVISGCKRRRREYADKATSPAGVFSNREVSLKREHLLVFIQTLFQAWYRRTDLLLKLLGASPARCPVFGGRESRTIFSRRHVIARSMRLQVA